MRLFSLLLALALVGCTGNLDEKMTGLFGAEHHIERGQPTTFAIDPSFTGEERIELELAAADVESEGLIVSFGGAGDGHIVRGKPDYGRPFEPDEHYAFSTQLFTMWIVPDDAMKRPGAVRAAARDMLQQLSR